MTRLGRNVLLAEAAKAAMLLMLDRAAFAASISRPVKIALAVVALLAIGAMVVLAWLGLQGFHLLGSVDWHHGLRGLLNQIWCGQVECSVVPGKPV